MPSSTSCRGATRTRSSVARTFSRTSTSIRAQRECSRGIYSSRCLLPSLLPSSSLFSLAPLFPSPCSHPVLLHSPFVTSLRFPFLFSSFIYVNPPFLACALAHCPKLSLLRLAADLPSLPLLGLQMPEEVKRVVKRVEELDKQNRELQEKLKQSKDHENHADMLRKNRIEITELRVSNKTLSAKVDELKKEKELLEKKSESERRLLENRTRNLFDLNVKSTQKLQGELDLRIAERLHNRSADNEVASLRRRNLELLGQINALDEQKMAAENKLRDAERKSRELKDKLELYATIHRIDLGKLQFSSDLNTEEELSAFLGDSSASSQGRKKKIRTQSRSVTPGLFSRPPPSAEDQKRSQSAQPGGGNWSGAAAEMSTTTGEQVRASARMEAEEESLEGLKAKVAQLQAKLTGEEKTKTNAQEKVIALAEQLVEKDRQITALQSSLDAEKETKKKKKKSERLRDLEGQVLSLITKVRETEMDKDQVEIKLNEKEEETKVKARKIGELIFKVSQLEEEKARIIEELAEVRIQAARQTKPEADPKSSTMPPRVIREESLGAGRMKISSSLNRPLKEETFSATMDRDRSEDIKT
uniref:Uncharacterized protein n=1 Tax=Guillardia theta TaxID=55529 RepID=A0A7S4KEV6_GUITH|mmetsp:Transcript_23504/g.76567  ORF Transcript_23504/g.76567 Transcript_23504/m.76567 type:complete len:588 (+) Transcript_23504:1373-3136(+)